MKCRDFDENLGEYTAGRLSGSLRAQMTAHSANCPACALKETQERELRMRFREARPVPECPDLWPQLARQLQNQPMQTVFRPIWAYGSAVAACMACAGLLWITTSSRPPVTPRQLTTSSSSAVAGADEQRVVNMVLETRQMPSTQSEALLTNVQERRDDERAILLGGSVE